MPHKQNPLRQVLQPSLRQTVSLRQLQFLRLLQLGTLELNAWLSELQLENPLVEVEPPALEQPAPLKLAGWLSPGADPIKDDWPDAGAPEMADDAMRYDLLAYLRSQFDLSLSDFDLSLLERLIASLDSDGFLTAAPDELAALWDADPALTREAADYLKTLDPPGIGAQNLAECLSIQLRRRAIRDPVAFELVRHHLEPLALGHFQKTARAVGSTPERVRALYEVIRTLHPRPASAFGGDAPVYLLPDVTVTERGGRLTCLFNRQYAAQMRVSQNYLDLARHDDKTRQYLNRKMSQALWILRAVDSRRQTVERLVDFILERQREFFLSPGGALVPLRLRDAAEALQIHESTVSRAISDKYLQCRRGVFPLKYFFTSAVAAADDTAVGRQSVQARIREMVKQEDPRHPLSDQAIAAALAEKGIALARRTVTKYREELGIVSSTLRRHIGSSAPENKE